MSINCNCQVCATLFTIHDDWFSILSNNMFKNILSVQLLFLLTVSDDQAGSQMNFKLLYWIPGNILRSIKHNMLPLSAAINSNTHTPTKHQQSISDCSFSLSPRSLSLQDYSSVNLFFSLIVWSVINVNIVFVLLKTQRLTVEYTGSALFYFR